MSVTELFRFSPGAITDRVTQKHARQQVFTPGWCARVPMVYIARPRKPSFTTNSSMIKRMARDRRPNKFTDAVADLLARYDDKIK
jgi:hypothetical protein